MASRRVRSWRSRLSGNGPGQYSHGRVKQQAAKVSEHERPEALFGATHWSVVLRAKDGSVAGLNALCAAYRAPLLVWLRHRGLDSTTAEDCVQSFFERLLRRDFLARVSPEFGRFRTFLLTSLRHHLSDQCKHRLARKRGGGSDEVSLDETDDDGDRLHDAATAAAGPDLAYDRAWAETLLATALQRLTGECAGSGHERLWTLIEPVLFADATAPAYALIAEQLAMSEGAVKMAVHRIRVRLRGLIHDEVLKTVASEDDVPGEVAYLISLFGTMRTVA
jgi:RNA polymerase sigma factor (sigma-70 family)